MKKVNYKYLKSVEARIDEIYKDGVHFTYKPFGSENKLIDSANIFNPEIHHINSEEVLAGYFDEKNIEKYNRKDNRFSDYSYVYKRVKSRISLTKPNKNFIKNQIVSFMKLLSTNPNEAYFVGNLLVSIYEATNFESKENPYRLTTDEEKKQLLDIPLNILKQNKDVKTFKRGVLYEMLSREMFQEVLFDESHILSILFNDENFQQNKRNQSYVEERVRLSKENRGR